MPGCPGDEELEALLQGSVEQSAGVLRAHVDTCPACQDRLASARSDEELVAELRTAVGGGGPVEPAPVPGGPVPGLSRYRILKRLGRGGMGIVYEAEQDSPRRKVALKVLHQGAAPESALRRFQVEAEVLARLEHPGVARIYEAGTFSSASGRQPFFAMELVRGRPLTAAVQGLEPRARLQLFAAVCDAVQHAHQKGVIHRDLKPANILVTNEGVPKVLDFGVARVTGSDVRATLETRTGTLVGTLPYMSPEQVSGDPARVDARADVYALGVILFELLTGRLPRRLEGCQVPEAVRRISETPPLRLGALDRGLRGDLDAIAAKALESDRERRYASAEALAEDVRRHLRSEPVEARPPSSVYQITRFARRHPALVGTAALAVVLLLAGLSVSLTLLVRARAAEAEARAQRTESEEERHVAEAARRMFQELLIQARPEEGRGGGATLRDLVAEASRRVLEDTGEDPRVRADVAHSVGRVYAAWGDHEAAERHLEEALAIYERHHGRRHRKVAYVLTDLVKLRNAQGRVAEAAALARRAASMRDLLEGDGAVILATAIQGHAIALFKEGRIGDAEPHFREALALYRRAQGDQGPDVAILLGNLALVAERLNRTQEATRLYRRALEAQRQALGPQNPLVASNLGNLALHLKRCGQLAEATRHAREALAITEGSVGASHPRTAIAARCLGEILWACDNHEEAMQLVGRALAIQRGALGPAHPRIVQTLTALGGMHQEADDPERAHKLLQEAATMAGRILAPENPLRRRAEEALAGLNDRDEGR